RRSFQGCARPNSSAWPLAAPLVAASLVAAPLVGAPPALAGADAAEWQQEPPSCRGRAASAHPKRSGRYPASRRCPLFGWVEARGDVGTTRRCRPNLCPRNRGSTQSFDGEAKPRRREWAAPLCQFHDTIRDTIRALPIKCAATDVMSQSAFNRFAGHAIRGRPRASSFIGGVCFYRRCCFYPAYFLCPRRCFSPQRCADREGFAIPI